MSIFKEVKNTVKNIFNADDDMIFDDENEFQGNQSSGGFPKIQFPKKNNEKLNAMGKSPLPSFDAASHDFNAMQQGIPQRKGKSNGRIQVYVPKTFEESFNIIKDVKSGFTAMVNVEVANPQVSQRIIDVISGAIYALDGDCKKMGEKQYIFSLSTETVGAYDYLPVNGAQVQNPSQFNFNMGQNFDFANQQQNSNPFMQGQGFPQQSFNPQGNFQQQPQFNPNQDFGAFKVPPQSQF